MAKKNKTSNKTKENIANEVAVILDFTNAYKEELENAAEFETACKESIDRIIKQGTVKPSVWARFKAWLKK